MNKKRIIAVLSAAVLAGTALPVSAWAADSYASAEKASIAKKLETFSAAYNRQLEETDKLTNGQTVDFTLALEDGAKSLLSALTSMDFSWLNSISLGGNVVANESGIGEGLTLKLNDTDIMSLNATVDLDTLDTYISVPELLEGYVKVAGEQILAQADAAEDAVDDTAMEQFSVDVDDLSEYLKSCVNASESFPDADTLTSIANRYLGLLFDAAAEGESGTEALSVDTVSQDCTTLTGSYTASEAVTALTDILTTARDDEELKSVLDQVASIASDSDFTYENVQSEIDELLEELKEADTSDATGTATSKIWLDSEDNIVGRELTLNSGDDANDTVSFILQRPQSDDKSAFRLYFANGDDENISIVGSGTTTDGLLSGYYELSFDSQAVLGITVTDYDAEAFKNDGELIGTYAFSLLPGSMDDDTYQSVSMYGLTVTCTETSISLAVSMSETPLAALTFSYGDGEAAEIADPADMSPVYDASNEDDMTTVSSSLTVDTLLENLTNAGMTEDFLNALMGTSTDETEVTEDVVEEETVGTDAIGDAAEDTTEAAE